MSNGIFNQSNSSLGAILLVDDEENITSLLRYNLENESYDVDVEEDAGRASRRDLTGFRLMLVDAMKQSFNGRALLRSVKANPLTAHIPVIFVAHSDSEDDIIAAFADGADDYILKPFSLRELVARVKSVLRRNPVVTRAGAEGAVLRAQTLELDLMTRTVKSEGQLVALTKTEFAILALLMKNKGSFFNRREIYQDVWASGDRNENDRIVDTNISRLRKKLGASASAIVNQTGKGYAVID